jgi:hypothetical protein
MRFRLGDLAREPRHAPVPRRAGLDSLAIGIAGRMLLLGAVAAGSALATALAGKAGIRATYLAMAVSAAVIAVAVGSPLVRRAAAR